MSNNGPWSNRRKGKVAMMKPHIAKEITYGLYYRDKLVTRKPLDQIMEEWLNLGFKRFIEKTLCSLMDDFGVITSTKKRMSDTLVEKQSEFMGRDVSIKTIERYLRILRENDIIRKIDNKNFVVNPYQLYKNPAISGDKLWQIQTSWELKKVMTRWIELEDIERLNILENKAKLDQEWARKKKEEIIKENEEIKKVYEDKDNIYIDMLLTFIPYAKKHYDEWGFYENQSIEEYLAVDKNVRKFRNWYMKWTKDERSKDARLKFNYNQRGSYRDAFLEIARRYNKENQNDN